MDEQTKAALDRAAQTLADCIGQSWADMPEEDRQDMRGHATAISWPLVSADREGAALACEELVSTAYRLPGLYGEASACKRCAAAIRSRGDMHNAKLSRDAGAEEVTND